MNQIDDIELARRLRADIERMVGDAGQSVPPTAPRVSIAAGQPGGRPSWFVWSAAAAVVLLLVGGLVVLAGRDTDDTPAPSATTTPDLDSTLPPETAPPEATVAPTTVTGVDELVEYEVIGSVIDDGSGAQLCSVVLESLPPQCGSGIALGEWSWDAIDVEQNQNGISWVDSIYLRGTFSDDGTFTVAETRIPTDEERERLSGLGFTLDFSVPCPAPEGGWPARRQEWPTADIAAIDGYAGNWINEAEGNVQVVKFTGDLALAEAAVREFYDGPLCVAPAQHTEQELLAIQNTLMSMSSVQFSSTAIYVDATGEWVQADLMRPNPDLQASFDAEFGTGVVRLSSPFHPVRGDATSAAPTTTIVTTAPPAADQPVEVEAVYPVLETVGGVELCLAGDLDTEPPSCDGVQLAGFSWDSIDDEEVGSNYTLGHVYIRGSYDPSSETLTVEEQRRPNQSDANRVQESLYIEDTSTPCEAPTDGWSPSGAQFPGQQIAALDGFGGAWSEAGGPWTLKFTGDLTVARQQIEQLFDEPVCLVAAAHSLDSLRAIEDQLAAKFGDLGSPTEIVDRRGEIVEYVTVAPRPDVQAYADAQFGPGVVRVRSWLLPVD